MTGIFIAIFIVALVLSLLILFKPNSGLVPLWFKMKKQSERVLLEDSLKHLYDCEYNAVDCSLNSLSGYLSSKSENTAKIISRLEELGLMVSEKGKLSLTNEGRTYALKVIRVHRLWEKYLADHTSVHETDWHNLAEEKEHQLNAEDTQLLAARLGNPLRDPHGDPIPSENGEMPISKGILLNDLQNGKFARIIHIEDEPKEIYAQISALGLYPGMQIQVIENSKDKIKFAADGEECLLAPVLAARITTSLIPEHEQIKESFRNLSSIKAGEKAVVVGISNVLRGQLRRRLLDFGIVPGTKIKVLLESVGGDPVAYDVRGAIIALRKNQSDHIYINKIENEG